MPKKSATKAPRKRRVQKIGPRVRVLRRRGRGSVTPARVMRPALSTDQRVHGTELLVQQSIASGVAAYSVNLALSAQTMGARLSQLAHLFEKYRINNLVFDMTLNGSISHVATTIVALDTDVRDDPPLAATGTSILASWRHNVIMRWPGDPHVTMPVRISQPDSGYYTNDGDDQRLSYFGRLLVLTTYADAVTLTIKVTYDVTLYEPQTGDGVAAAKDGVGAGLPAAASFSWDTLMAPALGRIASALHGVEHVIEGGHDLLQLYPGVWRLMQTWKPNTAPGGGATGPSNAKVVMSSGGGYSLANELGTLTDSTSETAVNSTLITVPAANWVKVCTDWSNFASVAGANSTWDVFLSHVSGVI